MALKKTIAEWQVRYPNLNIGKIRSTKGNNGRALCNPTQLQIKCPECGKLHWIWPSASFHSGRCWNCRKTSIKTIEDFKEEFLSLEIVSLRRKHYEKGDAIQLEVKCPNVRKIFGLCDVVHWISPTALRHQKTSNRLGYCASCTHYKDGAKSTRQGYRWHSFHGKSISEHRYMMEQFLGRKLRSGETVHHVNAKRADNRQENLELREKGKHPRGWSINDMARRVAESIPVVNKKILRQLREALK